MLEFLASVLAPPTLAAALLYWFGLEFTLARTGYFGLGVGTLGYTTTDYVIRGVQAGIVPLIVLLLLLLVAVLAHAATGWLADRAREAPWFRPAVVAVLLGGVAITALGTYGVFRRLPGFLGEYLLPPALLAAGPLLAMHAAGLLRRPGTPTPATARIAALAVGGLVVLSVFWGASVYASALGRGRAAELATRLHEQPRVTLYSVDSLGIHPSVAAGQRLTGDAAGRYAYRYGGLRLLIRSDGKYFLLPDDWTPALGTVLVIQDTADVRVEFSPGGRP